MYENFKLSSPKWSIPQDVRKSMANKSETKNDTYYIYTYVKNIYLVPVISKSRQVMYQNRNLVLANLTEIVIANFTFLNELFKLNRLI